MITSELVEEIAKAFNVSVEDLVGHCRVRWLTRARHGMWKALHMRGWSKNRIARLCSRDHTTVISGIEKAEIMMERDLEYKVKIHWLSMLGKGISYDEVAIAMGLKEKPAVVVQVVQEQPPRGVPSDYKLEKPSEWGAESWVRSHVRDASMPQATQALYERMMAVPRAA